MAAKMTKTRTPGIFKRGSRYVAIAYDASGRQRKRSFPTMTAARAWKSASTTDRDRGEQQPNTKITLHTYAREWVTRYRGTGRTGFRENTRAEYRRLLENYALKFFSPRLKLVDVTPHAMAKFVGWLASEEEQGKRLSHSTIANATVPLRAMYSTAVAEGLLRHDPTARLKLPPRASAHDEDESVKALSRVQLRRLLEIAPGKYKLLLGLLASTGLRISEARALQWKHVEQGADPAILVRRAMVRKRIERPKSRHGVRRVPLPQTLADALADARAQAKDPGEDGLVFASRRGTPIDPDNLRKRMLVPLLADVGVDAGGWHLLRHTCASIRLADGQSVVQVSRMLGHHSPGFTLATYTHLLDGEHAPALDLSVALKPPEEAFEGDALEVEQPALLEAA